MTTTEKEILQERVNMMPAGLMDQLNFVKHISSKGEVDDYLIIEEYPEIDYTLLIRESSYLPYVAAWAFDKEINAWGQGHYFERMIDAAEYIREKLYGQENVSVEEVKERDKKIIEAVEDCKIEEPEDDYDEHWNRAIGWAVERVDEIMKKENMT